MIRLILKGGLGNQMFQYAAAYSLAKKHNTTLLLDTTFLDTNWPIKEFVKRDLELDLFNIDYQTTGFSGSRFINNYLGYLLYSLITYFGSKPKCVTQNQAFNALDKLLNQQKSCSEPSKEDFDNFPQDMLLECYMNDYRLFEVFRSEICEMYDTDKLIDDTFSGTEEAIRATTSVAVNIRRGDFLFKKNKLVMKILDDNYFTQAIKIIKSKVPNPHFFIFNYDYPEGMTSPYGLSAKEYSLLGREFVGDRFKTYLRLASICNHNILSNSTFSFWGGYLNKHTDKVVVAPTFWDTSGKEFSLPKDWLKVTN